MAADKSRHSAGNSLSSPAKARQAAASTRPSPRQNHLLDALPTSDYERLASHLEPIPMNLGDVLYESGDKLRYVYFPTTSIVSLLYVMEDGASAEIAVVGNECFDRAVISGVSAAPGAPRSSCWAVVGGRRSCSRGAAGDVYVAFRRARLPTYPGASVWR